MRHCDVCSDPIDEVAEDFHSPHDVDCPGDGCGCDLVTHPECCPTCHPLEVEGQLSISDVLAVAS